MPMMPWHEQERYKSLSLFFLFIFLLSESYYRKVKNVIYSGYERTWPLSYKIGHRKFRPNYKFLEKNHDIFRVGQDLRGLPCSTPASFSRIFPQFILQNNQIASAKYCMCMIPGTPAWSLSFVITVFSLHPYQSRYATSMTSATRCNISIELRRTNLLSLTFSFGAQGQGFQQLGEKFSIFQFFIFLTGLPVRANDCWK